MPPTALDGTHERAGPHAPQSASARGAASEQAAIGSWEGERGPPQLWWPLSRAARPRPQPSATVSPSLPNLPEDDSSTIVLEMTQPKVPTLRLPPYHEGELNHHACVRLAFMIHNHILARRVTYPKSYFGLYSSIWKCMAPLKWRSTP